MFFGNHRGAFLEFLRNLSPQIMLLTIGLVAISGLGNKFDPSWQGFMNVLPAAVIFLVLAGAVFANVSQFLDKLTEESEEVKADFAKAKTDVNLGSFPGRGLRLFGALLSAWWRHQRLAVIRWVGAFLIVECGVLGVAVAAIPQALSALNATHGGHSAQAGCPTPSSKKLAIH